MTIVQPINTTRKAINTITKMPIGINCHSGGDHGGQAIGYSPLQVPGPNLFVPLESLTLLLEGFMGVRGSDSAENGVHTMTCARLRRALKF